MMKHPPPQLDSESVYPLLLAALRKWHKSVPSAFAPFQNWRLMQQTSQTLNTNDPFAVQQAVTQMLAHMLDELAHTAPDDASFIQKRFIKDTPLRKLALDMDKGIDTVNRMQRAALTRLADLVVHRESELRRKQIARQEAALPPPTYSRFFGHDRLRKRAVDALFDAAAAPLILVSGLGGIGKSALADVLARQVIRQCYFNHVIWVRLEAETMHGRYQDANYIWQQLCRLTGSTLNAALEHAPLAQQEQAIRQTFKSEPCLVVIDNLEEPDAVRFLLKKLSSWIHPSRFILTTRSTPVSETAFLSVSLSELDQSDSLSLLKHEAQLRGLEALCAAKPKDLQPIVAHTGGNPLALKLVVGLAQALSIEDILADLTEKQPGPAEEMYRRIYYRAWRALSQDARDLLEAMPLISETGGQREQMLAVSGLDAHRLSNAIQELVSRSLLEARGSEFERRYGIHRLTESFLKTEIIRWEENDNQLKL